jgi:transposase
MGAPARREFTDEFKREAVALWETSGRLQTNVARELGIQPSMLRRWQVRPRGGSRPPPSPVTVRANATPLSTMPSPADQAAEIARLRRELERTRMERDILKKRSASARRCRGEVRVRPRSRRPLAGPGDVPRAGRVAER